MGETTAIEWAHSTFNPWQGCTKVSAGCANCYAERDTLKFGKDLWGLAKDRPRTSAKYWQQPLKWDAEAQTAGERRRVFCASFADVGEDRLDLVEARQDLQILIERTPMLDWLLLTKRPQNLVRLFDRWNGEGGWPPNAWAGTSVENQAMADARVPELLKVPAAIRFISAEPLLDKVDLVSYLWRPEIHGQGPSDLVPTGQIHWVIAGGESGPAARPMRQPWARQLRDQCQAAGVAYFFKQWGEYIPSEEWQPRMGNAETLALAVEGGNIVPFRKVGKHAAGRTLDGKMWSEFPEAAC